MEAQFSALDPAARAAVQQQLQHTGGDISAVLGGAYSKLGGTEGELSSLVQQASGGLGGIAGQYGAIASGEDPRFAAFEEGQRGLLNEQRQRTLDAGRAELARTGVTGSVAINQLNRLNEPFDTQERALAGEIGMQSMSREDAARAAQAGVLGQNIGLQSGLLGQRAGVSTTQGQLASQLLGQQAGLAQQQFGNEVAATQAGNEALESTLGARTAASQNYAINPALLISQLAAQNAGTVNYGGGATVICTLLYERGDLPAHIYWADVGYGATHIRPVTLRGYHLWARPLVTWAKRSPDVYGVVRYLGQHWAHHMAYLHGAHDRPDMIGAVLLHTVKPLCTLLGRIVRSARRRARGVGYAYRYPAR